MWAHDIRNIIDNSDVEILLGAGRGWDCSRIDGLWCMWWQVASWCPMKDILPDEILSLRKLFNLWGCIYVNYTNGLVGPCLIGSWIILFVEVSFGLSFTLSVLYLLFFGTMEVWTPGLRNEAELYVRGWRFLWCIFIGLVKDWTSDNIITFKSSRLGPIQLGLSARRQGLLWSICYIHVDYWNTKFSPVNGIFFYTNSWLNHGLRYDPFWASFWIQLTFHLLNVENPVTIGYIAPVSERERESKTLHDAIKGHQTKIFGYWCYAFLSLLVKVAWISLP